MRTIRFIASLLLWLLAIVVVVKGFNPLEAAVYATIALFLNPTTGDFIFKTAWRLAGGDTLGKGGTSLSPATTSGLADRGKALRAQAGKLRIMGRFDEAYDCYNQAYPLYVKLNDRDSQCNVLCSLAETTPNRREIQGFIEKIETIISEPADTEERDRMNRNLDALKQRLQQSRGWPS